jgi:hypothetical protein
VLSISEYEDLYRATPGAHVWEADPRAAAEQLRAWARAHPDLAQRSPAREILAGMEEELAALESRR